MKGLERTMDGRCRIGSQFMIWVGDLEYKVGVLSQLLEHLSTRWKPLKTIQSIPLIYLNV